MIVVLGKQYNRINNISSLFFFLRVIHPRASKVLLTDWAKSVTDQIYCGTTAIVHLVNVQLVHKHNHQKYGGIKSK